MFGYLLRAAVRFGSLVGHAGCLMPYDNVAEAGECCRHVSEERVVASPEDERLGSALTQPGVELLIARDGVLVVPQPLCPGALGADEAIDG
jgi:hypothetical protein